jgi:hypothetical protein
MRIPILTVFNIHTYTCKVSGDRLLNKSTRDGFVPEETKGYQILNTFTRNKGMLRVERLNQNVYYLFVTFLHNHLGC